MCNSTPIVKHNMPDRAPEVAVIWLHGLGADGSDFVPIIPHLGLPETYCIKFIFPNAPSRPVTINGGYQMPAWYDIVDMSLDRKVDLDQLLESASAIRNLIDEEVKGGIAADKIFVAGFSQGGAVAIHAALTYPQRLAGLICLSTYLVGEDALQLNKSTCNQDLSIFWGHGVSDDVVTFDYGERSTQGLSNMAYKVSWHKYPISHEVSLPEIRDIGEFIASNLV